MSPLSSHGTTSDKLSSKVIGPFGGEGEKYLRSGEINGIDALYNTDFIWRITFRVKPGTSTEVQHRRRSDGWNTYKVGLGPKERITHLLGYFKKEKVTGSPEEKIVITSLRFETSNKRTLGPIGTESGKPFTVLPAAGEIIEFFVGLTGEDFLTSIGARVKLTSKDSRSVEEKSVKSIGPFGGGRPWNDGIFTDVKEIHLIVSSDTGISYIGFVYDFGGKKDIKVTYPEGFHPSPGSNVQKVPLNHTGEYFTSISGHVGDDGSIKALEIYTSLTSYHYGDPKNGKYFWYPSTGADKIVGFHGAWGETLNAIGVYVEPILPPPSPVPCAPITNVSGGKEWDDGREHSHVIGYRVTASVDQKRIESITFMYDDNGSTFIGDRHGGGDKSSGEWVMLNFPEERLKLLKGYSRRETPGGDTTIHNLRLITTSTTRPRPHYAEKFERSVVERLESLKFRKEELEALEFRKEELTKSEKKELKELTKKFKGSEKKELEELTMKFKGSKPFKIPEHNKGRRISGFFGRADTCLNSIGAYVGSY